MGKITSYILNVNCGMLKDGEKITIGKDNISIKLLLCLLSDKYFDEMRKIYVNKINRINFSSNESGITTYSSFTISSISQAFMVLLNQDLGEFEKKRINTLLSLNNFDTFIKNEQDKSFSYEVDKRIVTLSCREIITFLTLDEDSYRKKIKDKWFKDGISIEQALYVIKKGTRDYLDKYVFPPYILDRIKNINHSKDVDIEALNEVIETKSCWLNKTILDKDFEKEVLDAIPKNLKLIEKAIYLYILLCLIMTYDPYYFAYEEDNECNIKHKSINYLSSINRKNNRLVCYEFSNIYGYFLAKLGINFEVFSDEDFYQYHTSVFYRVGKYLVSADSVTSVLSGDLIRCKLGLPLVGLMLANQNMKTQKEFKKVVDKVYGMFNILELEIPSLTGKSIQERLNMITSYANQYPLDIIDKFALIYLYKKVFFTKYELEDLTYTVLRNNDKDSLLGIFTISDRDGNRYFMYKYNQELQEIDEDYLKDMLKKEVLSYVPNSIERVPFSMEGYTKKKQTS